MFAGVEFKICSAEDVIKNIFELWAKEIDEYSFIPLEDNLDNKMVYVRRKGINLSSCALKFVNVMFDYFDTYKP